MLINVLRIVKRNVSDFSFNLSHFAHFWLFLLRSSACKLLCHVLSLRLSQLEICCWILVYFGFFARVPFRVWTTAASCVKLLRNLFLVLSDKRSAFSIWHNIPLLRTFPVLASAVAPRLVRIHRLRRETARGIIDLG